jgi:hypothetical protein
MGSLGVRGWFFLAFVGVAGAASLYTSGCAAESTTKPRASADTDAGQKTRPTTEEKEEEEEEEQPSTSTDRDRIPDPGIVPPTDPDAGAEAGAPEAGVTDCTGKPNGTKIVTASAENVCCDGKPTDLTKPENCGVCGLACGGGRTCAVVQPGQWGCKGCSTNLECQQLGYGPAATCFADACNCQCGGDGTCKDQCKNGATCHQVSGTNYCAYP